MTSEEAMAALVAHLACHERTGRWPGKAHVSYVRYATSTLAEPEAVNLVAALLSAVRREQAGR
jgi:hypothetical protein